MAEELIVPVDADDEDHDDDLLESDVPDGAPDDEFDDDSATARFRLTRAQVAGFIARAASLVLSGRPICPLCGRPIDPDGHACPRLN